MINTNYYRALFISKAAFNLVACCLLVFFFNEYLALIGLTAMTDDALSTMFLRLFALMVLLFGGIYAWIGFFPGRPESYALAILGILAQVIVFSVTIVSALLFDVAWIGAPIFGFVDLVYAYLFINFLRCFPKIQFNHASA